MSDLSNRTVRRMQQLSWELGDCPPARLEQRAMRWLCKEFGGDSCSICDLRPGPQPVTMHSFTESGELENLQADVVSHLSAGPSDHPLLVHYVNRHSSVAPVRLSDAMSFPRLRRTRAYAEVLRPYHARFQLILLSRRSGPSSMTAYCIQRCTRDFGDDAVEVSLGLQPILWVLQQAAHRPVAGPRVDEVSDTLSLTAAEFDVLRLLAAGLTAAAISHARRTSVRTTRKHLEQVYAKLDCHDRLLAVAKAERIGLLRRPRSHLA